MTKSFFYKFRVILLALGIIGAIEASVLIFHPSDPLVGSSLLQLEYLSDEPNTILVYRISEAVQAKAEVLQVGDSSGQRGIIPRVVMPHVGGLKYLNASMGADSGYLGHYEVAKAVIDRTPTVKMLVFYVTPFASPVSYGGQGRRQERQIEATYSSPLRYLVAPSEQLRTAVVNLVYYWRLSGKPGFFPRSYELFRQSNGWVPHEAAPTARNPVDTEGCFFNWFNVRPSDDQPIDFFYTGLEKLALLARAKGIPLVVAFSPVACKATQEIGVLTIERQIARFRQNYPEVIFPFPLITTYPAELFADPNHLWTPGAEKASLRLGIELEKVAKDPRYRGVPPRPVQEIDVLLQQAREHVARPSGCESPTASRTADAGSLDNNVTTSEFTNCIGIRFKPVPPGAFIMGSCANAPDCPPGALPDIQIRKDERKAHQVVIPKAFQIGETSVTVAQFRTFLESFDGFGEDPRPPLLATDPLYLNANRNDSDPVTMVSWDHAQAFVRWLNRIKPATDNGVYRLPTEAEREYATRSESQEAYWWGNLPKDGMANCINCGGAATGKVAPVASFPPNKFGLYEMNGNIFEWVEDCYRGWYNPAINDPRPFQGSGTCRQRVIRGGAADVGSIWARSAARFYNVQSSRSPTLGFRVVREVP